MNTLYLPYFCESSSYNVFSDEQVQCFPELQIEKDTRFT